MIGLKIELNKNEKGYCNELLEINDMVNTFVDSVCL